MKWAVLLVPAAVLLGLWWWARLARVPTVREIQAERKSFEDIKRQVARVPRVQNPDAYARALYRRAYGKNP